MPPLPSLSPGYQFCTVEYFYIRIGVGENFDYGSMKLVLVTHRRGTSFEVADMAVCRRR